MHRAARGVHRVLSHPLFFVAVLAVFAAEALLIALSAREFQLYDEWYHFGIVEIFAKQWSPFVHQGDHYDRFGDLQRSGSLLYHWLLSFPDRVMIWSHASEYTRVVVLRVITIAIHVAGLVWFRRILRELGVSAAVIAVSLIVYAALPMTSTVAATINYDNLAVLLGGIHLLAGVRIVLAPRSRLSRYLTFVSAGALLCLSSFQFLPVYATSVIIVLVVFIVRVRRTRPAQWFEPVATARGGRAGLARLIASLVVAALSIAYFVERYVGNILRYRTPQPDCAVVHSDAFCAAYPPWQRNQQLDAAFPDLKLTPGSALHYLVDSWLPNIMRTFSLVGMDSGRSSGGAPITATILLNAGLIAAVIALLVLPFLLRNRGMLFLAGPIVVFTVVLFHTNLDDDLRFGIPVAVQSRYYLVFLLPMLAGLGHGLTAVLRRAYRRGSVLYGVLISLALVLFCTQGGGVLTYLAFSQGDWFAPNAPLGAFADSLRVVAQRVIIG